MNNSQQVFTATTMAGRPGSEEHFAQWQMDDDVALGCECADPALQIERWGQEAAQLPAPQY